MTAPLTATLVLQAFDRMEMSGLKRPEAFATIPKLQAAAATWVAILSPMTADAFAAAIMAHMRDPDAGRFWPTPAHIIGRAEALAAAAYPDAAEAFPRVLARRSSFGAHREDDALAQLEVDGFPLAKVRAGIAAVGGWADMGKVPDPDHGGDAKAYGYARRDFIAAYNGAKVAGTALAVIQ